MLETGRVGGVTGDGNVNVLFPHDSNALTNVVSAVAVYFCTGAIGVSLAEYLFQLAGVVIILCLNIGETVDTGDDLSSVFSKTVQDNAERFLTYTCLLSSAIPIAPSAAAKDSWPARNAEALGILFQKHFTKVTMSKTYFTLVSNGTRDTESLKAFSDSCSSLGSLAAVLFDSDCCAY